MIQKFGAWLNDRVKRWMPDPFVLALLLTLATILLALVLTPSTIADVLVFWKGKDWSRHPSWEAGFWAFLMFSMQMCLVLVTGHALAAAPAVRRGLERLAALPKSTGGGAALVAAVAMAAALFNWGFGLVAGAFLAREVARSAKRRGLAFHYPLLAAAGYAGLMVWHGGFSGSAPLDVAGNGVTVGGLLRKLPVTAMLLSPYNLFLNATLLIGVPLLFRALAPKGTVVEIAAVEEASPAPPAEESWLERNPVLPTLFAGLGLGVVAWDLSRHGARYFDLYSVPFLFLFVGMLLHGRLGSFVRAVEDGARGCAGIILQFPFYAGIYGIMMGTGLHAVFSDWTVGVTRAVGLAPGRVYPVLVFLAASVLNMFIPSGGGQWKLQGPVVCDAGEQLGVPLDRTVMAVAYGDELTNMLQPFWALPLLAITGLRAREIMGYTAAVMVLVSPLYVAAFLVF